jgi:PEP-CTERM motif
MTLRRAVFILNQESWMFKRFSLPAWVAASATLLACQAAQATITVYTTQASYLAAVSAPGVDTYDDLRPLFEVFPSPLNRNAGSYRYVATTIGSDLFTSNGEFPDPNDYWLTAGGNLSTVEFGSFAANVRGVGGFFFNSDVFGLLVTTPNAVRLTATDASGTVTITLTNPTLSSFVGFVADRPILNVRVSSPQGIDDENFPTINNLTLGAAVAAVPEPHSYALMLMGLVALGGLGRRKRS